MNVSLYESEINNYKIFFGDAKGSTNVTLSIVSEEIIADLDIYIDNVSIVAYEKRVFVAVLDNNWTVHIDEIARNSSLKAVKEASKHFQKQFGIKLIPLVEVPWDLRIEDSVVQLGEVHDQVLEDARKLLKLKQNWDVTGGRSIKNNGFDMLTCFTNRTGEHFGFIYGGENVAFHFAQSAFLQNALNNAGYGFIQVTVLDEWAESLAQHEISHIFGAEDRNSAEYPPSVMSKALTAEQAVIDLLKGTLWLQCNNWILEDALLILTNSSKFE
ncbi:MAG: hypothetical protein ACTSPI_05515 [Candidatus Heimdallarchaeaceae archaeon]